MLASKMFAFDDQVLFSMLCQQRLVISVWDRCTYPCLFLTDICNYGLLIGDDLNLTESVLGIVSLQSSAHVCGKIRLYLLSLTISLEIKMCTVLKALREVASFHLSASSKKAGSI